jgi:hypothetical protein
MANPKNVTVVTVNGDLITQHETKALRPGQRIATAAEVAAAEKAAAKPESADQAKELAALKEARAKAKA